MSISTTTRSQRDILISKEDVNAFFKQANIELYLNFDPISHDLEFRLTDDAQPKLMVGYIINDEYPADWKSFGYEEGMDDYKQFMNKETVEDYIAGQERLGITCLEVLRYEHISDPYGLNYSIEGTHNYPFGVERVETVGVFIPRKEHQEALKNGELSLEEITDQANETMNAYSNFCKGQSFGHCIDTFEFKADGSAIRVDSKHELGFYGFELAQKALKTDHLDAYQSVPKYKPSPEAQAEAQPER